MKKSKTNSCILIITALLLSFISVNAQKLPNIQKVSMRAPANTKIDGKTTEWDNKFQAYNKATDLFYTISNDNNNLYLTIQATDQVIVKRITNGGLSFTINKAYQRNNKNAAIITYPVFDSKNRFIGIFKHRGDPDSAPWYDSVMNLNNTRFAAKAKMISVVGIPDIDTLISVYNIDGIKAVALFNNKLSYTCELSVSLKHLGLGLNNVSKFAYQLKINAVEQHGITLVTKNGTTTDINIDPSQIESINISAGSRMGQYATDFWGEYTLAK
jgi:hypothetical protein